MSTNVTAEQEFRNRALNTARSLELFVEINKNASVYQLAMFMFVRANQGIKIVHVIDRFVGYGIDRSTVTRNIQHLSEDGYVKAGKKVEGLGLINIKPHSVDGRAKVASVTSVGEAYFQRMTSFMEVNNVR